MFTFMKWNYFAIIFAFSCNDIVYLILYHSLIVYFDKEIIYLTIVTIKEMHSMNSFSENTTDAEGFWDSKIYDLL